MNQDQVKEKLLELRSDIDEFSVIFSGKESKKVNGLYHPDSKEIIIHNKNFNNDNSIIYTAIHEFAHHIQNCDSAIPVSNRAHTVAYWNTFHHLLKLAEEKKIYINIFKYDKEFIELTNTIKQDYLSKNSQLMQEFGKVLLDAHQLCLKKNTSFEDYIQRELLLTNIAAKSLIKVAGLGNSIAPEIGFDNLKTISSIKNEEVREKAAQAFLEGNSPQIVKEEIVKEKPKVDPLELLVKEKSKIERTIQNLNQKLEKIEEKIKEIE